MGYNDQAAFTKSIWVDQGGVSSIEYAMLGSLIAVVIIGSVAAVGSSTASLWTMIKDCVASATKGISCL